MIKKKTELFFLATALAAKQAQGFSYVQAHRS